MKTSMWLTLPVFQLLIAANCFGQQKREYPPMGKLVDAGGHMLHMNITGKGSPTVVLENGTQDFSFIWSLVQPELSKSTRVVSYDRAGYAWSDPGPIPRTGRQIAFELHTALRNAGVSGPYILVGQSFGGFLVRAFAMYYPKDVAGMVLVDALNEDSKVHVGGGNYKRIREFAKGLHSPEPQTMSRNQLIKDDTVVLNTTIDPPLDKLPSDIQDLQIWAQSQKKTSKAARQEMDWSAEDVADVYANRGRKEYLLGDIPLIVISRGQGGYSGPQAQDLEKERLQLQKELARLSSNSKHIVDQNSGHNIHVEDPRVVIEAILQVKNAATNKVKLK